VRRIGGVAGVRTTWAGIGVRSWTYMVTSAQFRDFLQVSFAVQLAFLVYVLVVVFV